MTPAMFLQVFTSMVVTATLLGHKRMETRLYAAIATALCMVPCRVLLPRLYRFVNAPPRAHPRMRALVPRVPHARSQRAWVHPERTARPPATHPSEAVVPSAVLSPSSTRRRVLAMSRLASSATWLGDAEDSVASPKQAPLLQAAPAVCAAAPAGQSKTPLHPQAQDVPPRSLQAAVGTDGCPSSPRAVVLQRPPDRGSQRVLLRPLSLAQHHGQHHAAAVGTASPRGGAAATPPASTPEVPGSAAMAPLALNASAAQRKVNRPVMGKSAGHGRAAQPVQSSVGAHGWSASSGTASQSTLRVQRTPGSVFLTDSERVLVLSCLSPTSNTQGNPSSSASPVMVGQLMGSKTVVAVSMFSLHAMVISSKS